MKNAITQQELDEMVKCFAEENPSLVNEALEKSIEFCGRDEWNVMARVHQVDFVMTWIAGWKTRDAAPFVIKDDNWGTGWQAGETIVLPLVQDRLETDADEFYSYIDSVKKSIGALFDIMGRKEGSLREQINQSFDELPAAQKTIITGILNQHQDKKG